MSIKLENVSYQKQGVLIESQNSELIIKILKIAGLIFGLGILAFVPFISPMCEFDVTVSFTIIGAFLTLSSCRALCSSHSPLFLSKPLLTSLSTSLPTPLPEMRSSLSPLSSISKAISKEELLDHCFHKVDSSKLKTLYIAQKIASREDFLSSNLHCSSPLIGKSDFISKKMAEHLMRHKKDSALGKKYVVGDQITNMEGALHTFVVPVCRIFMTGDYKWLGHTAGLKGKLFGNNQVREIILSATIHPDFEFDLVIMPVIKIGTHALIGEPSDLTEIPSAQLKKEYAIRNRYEIILLKHMIYHLSPDHRRPSLDELHAEQIMDISQTQKYLRDLIYTQKKMRPLQGKFMRMKVKKSENTQEPPILSLEILFQIYVHQIRAEFKILNTRLTQGYVYTISPPSIFARALGGAEILNRVQALAFQSLMHEDLFSHMHILAFGDYADKEAVSFFKHVFESNMEDIVSLFKQALGGQNVENIILIFKQTLGQNVLSQSELFAQDDTYSGPRGLALVLHNNSDAFGQNIETEPPSSLDGVIGSFSNAACVLKRDRIDLVDFIL